jgi:hypothetical protein
MTTDWILDNECCNLKNYWIEKVLRGRLNKYSVGEWLFALLIPGYIINHSNHATRAPGQAIHPLAKRINLPAPGRDQKVLAGIVKFTI